MELIVNEFVIILLLILVNGFFAGAELAVLSARRSRISGLAVHRARCKSKHKGCQ